jgi:type I restriction enzyme S subunit
MIADLKPYPAMKDSSLEWLGEVPAHWDSRKLRTVLRSVTARNRPDLPLLSVVREKGVIVRDVSNRAENYNFIPDDLTNYKVVREGQFAMNKMKAWQGSYGVSRYDGIVSPAYFVFELDDVSGDYFNTAIRSKAYVPFFAQASDGVRIGQWDLSPARMREITFSAPPLAEQAAIVRYLDHVEGRVRRLVRAKRKLIALLTEQKQAIIHRAVTRGLDPDVPLKDSGVKWLGKVPEHWEVARLKDVAVLQTGITLGKTYKDLPTDSHPYLRVANVQVGRVDLREVKRVDVPSAEASGATLRDGDVLMTEGGDIDKLGRGCVWRNEIPGCLHQNHVFAVRCRPRLLDPEFLVGLMASQHGRAYFQLTAKQTTNLASTNSATLRAFPIMLPPLPEQRVILQGINSQSASGDKAIEDAQREIELLNEYRTRLIADVVTGKLDVREGAAALPQVDPLDAEADLDDTLETESDVDLDAIPEEAEA